MKGRTRRRAIDGLDHDIRDHIDRETQDNIERGMTPEEARHQAMLAFGNVALAKEDTRRVWIRAWLDEARQDLRYAARTLLKNRAFAAAATLTLALAIGSNTAMFSVLNAVVLAPLPYRAPDELAMLWTEDPSQNIREGRAALWNAEQWRSQSRTFADMAVFDAIGRTLTGPTGAEQIAGVAVSPNVLELLGVQPVLGRAFSTEEAEQQHRLVLISHRFWQARFGGASDAIGATIELDGMPSQIIGVLPAGFGVGVFGGRADVWEPQAFSRDVTTRPPERGGETWFVIGRLRSGVSAEDAQTEMSAVARRINEGLPAAERHRGIAVVPLSLQMVGRESRLALWMLGGAVFCVLLIAAANVASLSLARAVTRGHEMALRAALGATAGRIVRQLLTESLLLAALAGAMGTLLAFFAIRFISGLGPGLLPRLTQVSLDLRVLGWALIISVLAGLLVGLAPALTTRRRNVRWSSEEGGRTVTGGGGTRRLRQALVVAEFALAITLLVGAGLLVRSFWLVKGVDPGFSADRVVVLELSSPASFTSDAQRADLYHRVLQQIHAVPGVTSAGIIGDLFISNSREQAITTERDAGTVTERMRFRSDEASPDLFKALGTPLRRGRFFTSADGPDAPRVAIINDTMARRSWPGQNPLGRRFKTGPRDSDRPWHTVVGVVADMRRQGLEREPVAQIFTALAQNPPGNVDMFIRTATDDPLTLAAALQAAVHQVEKHAPVYGVGLLDDMVDAYLRERRFQTLLLAAFSIVALVMAAIGIYGLIQYSIAARTREIGVRMAIGARAGDIFRMVVGEGLRLSAIGLVLGLAGAWWLGRVISSLLFGVTAADPLTFAAVSLLLTAISIAACYVPARRAMKVDPVVALRVT